MDAWLESLMEVARRHSRVPHEAEDLLQDALLEALRAGRGDLTQAVNERWIAGTIRNLAAMAARGTARRRLREARWAEELPRAAPNPEPPPAWLRHPVLDTLPPSLRVVALLALAGHDRREVAWILGISDTALRKRISDLAKRLADEDWSGEGPPPSDLPLGLIRRALLPVVALTGSAGVHDPDGHLLILGGRGAGPPGTNRPHVPARSGNRGLQSSSTSSQEPNS